MVVSPMRRLMCITFSAPGGAMPAAEAPDNPSKRISMVISASSVRR